MSPFFSLTQGLNHVPDHPDNYTDDSLEDQRLAMVEEFNKRNRNVALIKQQMELSGDAAHGVRDSRALACSVFPVTGKQLRK